MTERRENIARALHDADDRFGRCAVEWPCARADDWRRLADAAIAADDQWREPFDLEAACEPVARQPKSVRRFRAAVDGTDAYHPSETNPPKENPS